MKYIVKVSIYDQKTKKLIGEKEYKNQEYIDRISIHVGKLAEKLK